MKVVALDPGGTTGWAVFEIPVDYETKTVTWGLSVADHFTDAGQLAGKTEDKSHHAELMQFLTDESPDIVVCERFEHRNNEFAELISVEYIGVLKAWTGLRRRKTPVVFQGASQAKTWADNKKLKHYGIYLPGQWKHANDARRHLVYFLTFQETYPLLSARMKKELKTLD